MEVGGQCGKSRPHRDSIPRTVQPIVSRYTDYAIPAHLYFKCVNLNIPSFVVGTSEYDEYSYLFILY
jgi:hypothetical protein